MAKAAKSGKGASETSGRKRRTSKSDAPQPRPKSRTQEALDSFSGRTIGLFTSWAGESAWRRMALLTVICFALFLPGIGAFGPTDRDEARYVQATKQMMETGDYVDIRFQETARHKKPVGIYWAQAASAIGLGGPEAPLWAYRIPSFIGALLASLLTLWAMPPSSARGRRFWPGR